MYSSFGRQVFQAKNSQEVVVAIKDLLKKLTEREFSEEEFNVGFTQVTYTKNQSSQKSLVQYILRKIAKHEAQPAIGHTDELTIEHLLPESSMKLGVPESTVGQIGNLLLIDTETNGLLGQKNFLAKKAILQKRGYKLPELFEDADEITPELIFENTSRISKIARTKIWKV